MRRVLVFLALTMIAAFVFYELVFSDRPKEPVKSTRDYAARSHPGDSKGSPDIVRRAEELHRETYQKRMEESLQDFESRLEDLKAETKKASRKTRQKLENAVDEMGRMLDDARAKLADLRKSTGEAWDRMKAKTDASLEALEKKYRDIISKKG